MRAKHTRYGVTTRACTSIAAAMGAALVTIAAIQGCSFDDSTDAAKPYHAQDGGPDGTAGDAGTGEETSIQGLCVKVGGYAAVQKIASETVTSMSNDCRMGGYFAALGADAKQHMVECFQVYMGATFDCTGVSYIGSKDSKGAACRDMKTAHNGLGITADDFLAFRQDIVATMGANKMQTTDVNRVMDLLTGVAGVYNGAKKGNYACTCPADSGECIVVRDAGIDADTGTGTDAASEGGASDAAADTGSASDAAPQDAGGGG